MLMGVDEVTRNPTSFRKISEEDQQKYPMSFSAEPWRDFVIEMIMFDSSEEVRNQKYTEINLINVLSIPISAGKVRVKELQSSSSL